MTQLYFVFDQSYFLKDHLVLLKNFVDILAKKKEGNNSNNTHKVFLNTYIYANNTKTIFDLMYL